MKRKQLFSFLVDLLFYIAGGMIYSVAVLLFLTENEISPGGLTGIATILNYLFSLPIGTVVFILNIPLLAAGFIKFGGIFFSKNAVATAVMLPGPGIFFLFYTSEVPAERGSVVSGGGRIFKKKKKRGGGEGKGGGAG